MDLQRLLGLGGEDHLPLHREGGAHVQLGDFLEILHLAVLKNHLEIFKATPVVELDKAQRLGRAQGPNPAADRHRLAAIGFGLPEKLCQFQSLHSAVASKNQLIALLV